MIASATSLTDSNYTRYASVPLGCYSVTTAGTFTIDIYGRCPNCLGYHTYADTNIYIEPTPPTPAEERALARQLGREASWRAIRRARLALQRALDDPHPEIPLADRKRPYARPKAKKRVCAGSSRYRVLVN